MSLDLDTRQRAMLQEMGVTVWQPEPVYITEHSVAVPEIAINKIAVQAVNTPATAINEPHRGVSERPPVHLPANLPVKQPASLAVALQPMPAGLQEMDWPTLQQAAQTCQACQLCTGRKGIVFGNHVNFEATNQQADWLIVGDPPTEADESAGAPFTGESGVLLGNMLKAMGLTVAEVTLTPAVKCRTEGQSTGAQELAQCEAFLSRQVALTRPKMILAMGRYAAQALLANSVSNPVPPLGQLRGVVHKYDVDGQSIPVVVTYSPANLLRNPADKAKAWADLCLAKASLVSK